MRAPQTQKPSKQADRKAPATAVSPASPSPAHAPLQALADRSPATRQLGALQALADRSPTATRLGALQAKANEMPALRRLGGLQAKAHAAPAADQPGVVQAKAGSGVVQRARSREERELHRWCDRIIARADYILNHIDPALRLFFQPDDALDTMRVERDRAETVKGYDLTLNEHDAGPLIEEMGWIYMDRVVPTYNQYMGHEIHQRLQDHIQTALTPSLNPPHANPHLEYQAAPNLAYGISREPDILALTSEDQIQAFVEVKLASVLNPSLHTWMQVMGFPPVGNGNLRLYHMGNIFGIRAHFSVFLNSITRPNQGIETPIDTIVDNLLPSAGVLGAHVTAEFNPVGARNPHVFRGHGGLVMHHTIAADVDARLVAMGESRASLQAEMTDALANEEATVRTRLENFVNTHMAELNPV